MSLTLRTDLQVELLATLLNTCGPRAILSSDSYPLDHSPVVIKLRFGTLSVPVASLSLRSTYGTSGKTFKLHCGYISQPEQYISCGLEIYSCM
ncbi:hypothetical protein HETIRDRAFT_162754 [Heterobasidion irregulare TC 32-1]|uniref:Uncharacterized protein n=1 Tax=Heterobasidion irregulare (strain TC 32-1) TaxID=747525 RepID=W4JSA4_HETIT|nr:uncharacterized protein HETIRDRAFT_162754 [Heterobasidion irregulare TC 32-1]ETW75985.1 hypothetical protein HETIRDRAFT_162754 [Heterobasidion irregulare TC 32-1]